MKTTWIFAVAVAVASGALTGSNVLGQSTSPVAGEFEQNVLPVLSGIACGATVTVNWRAS